jgi:hypothetical protein
MVQPSTRVLDREEYIEQAYFFRALRERLAENLPTQQILETLHEEILSTTNLPHAIEFLTTELKHTGLLSSGFAKLPHYFTPFQSLVMRRTEEEKGRFSVETGLLLLERESAYRGGQPTQAGLFVYALEAMSRNRLGYDEGLTCLKRDGFFEGAWCDYLEMVRRQMGSIDLCNLIYVRSQQYVLDRRRREPEYEPSVPPLFGEKEGKIAKANLGRDPLYLFAALQRQLGYPEVPRQRHCEDPLAQIESLKAKIRELETRLKLVEGEVRGRVDLSQFLAKPDLLHGLDEEA